jgi:hypothetical protein
MGAYHAIFYYNSAVQILCISILIVGQLSAIIAARKCFLLKTTFWINIATTLLKLLLHLILVLEVFYEELVILYDTTMSEITSTIMFAALLLNALEVILAYAIP